MRNEREILIAAMVVILFILCCAFVFSGPYSPGPAETATIQPTPEATPAAANATVSPTAAPSSTWYPYNNELPPWIDQHYQSAQKLLK